MRYYTPRYSCCKHPGVVVHLLDEVQPTNLGAILFQDANPAVGIRATGASQSIDKIPTILPALTLDPFTLLLYPGRSHFIVVQPIHRTDEGLDLTKGDTLGVVLDEGNDLVGSTHDPKIPSFRFVP